MLGRVNIVGHGFIYFQIRSCIHCVNIAPLLKKKNPEKSEKQKQKMDLEFESELTESKFYRAIL